MSDWYLKDPSGASSGPFATMDVVQWITAGRVGPNHLVCGVGSNRWLPIADVPMFGGALASSRAGAAARPAPTGPQVPPAAGRPAAAVERSSSVSFVGAPPQSRLSAAMPEGVPARPAQPAQPAQPTAASRVSDPNAQTSSSRVSAPPTPQPATPAPVKRSPIHDMAMRTMAVPSLMEAPEMEKKLRAAAAAVPPSARGRTMLGQMSFEGGVASGRMAIIGRAEGSDILLPYPQVSTRHTGVAPTSDGMLAVTDLGSTNGTHVEGKRIPPNSPVHIKPGDRIFIGPYAIYLGIENNAVRAWVDSENADWSGNLVEVEALDLVLKVPDRDDKSKDKVLLDHVTFKAHPGDLIALMGPSGAGKTTLLTVLNGYLRPSTGEVRVNGESLYAIYDALRGSIGYVPQDDIVHAELTVFEAIKYSAQFRLPSDFKEDEINRRVEQVIKDLGLEQVKNLEIGKPERKVLSGGQRKRVNIALELVTDPALMFLDEPTSGLAADDTVALIDLLANLAKKYGKTIIVTIHQPAREEYEKFNLALIMGSGGVPLYYGPTGKESYDFFGRYVAAKGIVIDNPRDMFDLLKKREEDALASGQFPNKAAARSASAAKWRAEFFQEHNPTYRKMFTGTRQPGKPSESRAPSRAKVPLFRQFWLLYKRYSTVKRRDRAGTAILLAQAPIIGVLLALVFSDPAKMPSMWCQQFLQGLETTAMKDGARVTPACLADTDRFLKVADFGGAIYLMAIAALWFGTSNAAREIVSEQAIYRRERMVNLSIFNYVMSKFTFLTIMCTVQCSILLGIVFYALGLGGQDPQIFLKMLGFLVSTAVCATAIGLLLSTVVTSAEAAMALTPIALIPQVVLGGRMVPMTNKVWLKYVMAAVPSRWSFEGLLGAERTYLAESWKVKACVATGEGIADGKLNCALEELRNVAKGGGGLGFDTFDRPYVALGVLGGMTLLALLAVTVLLKRRDSV
jgi:ABC transport system ATP-binding/permease protein